MNLFRNLSIFIEFFSNSKSAPLISGPTDTMFPVLRPHQTAPKDFSLRRFAFMERRPENNLEAVERVPVNAGKCRPKRAWWNPGGRGCACSGFRIQTLWNNRQKQNHYPRRGGPMCPPAFHAARLRTGEGAGGGHICLALRTIPPPSVAASPPSIEVDFNRDKSPPRARASLCRLVS